MVRSHRPSEYLDHPDQPNSATELDQVFGRGVYTTGGGPLPDL